MYFREGPVRPLRSHPIKAIILPTIAQSSQNFLIIGAILQKNYFTLTSRCIYKDFLISRALSKS